MGKDTDKMYITHSEWAAGSFGAGGFKNRPTGREFKRLPFNCCALSLLPFEVPRCTREGHIFDLLHILPWIKKHGTNPVTGAPLSSSDLIPLHFHKNAQEEFMDPVTFKVFSENTHLVAIPLPNDGGAHVYAWETIDELCVKGKSWRDLMTEEPFRRKDIITIQDPHNIIIRNINDFHYKLHDVAKPDTDETDPAAKKRREVESTINARGSTARILAAMAPATTTAPKKEAPITPSYVIKEAKSVKATHFSDNRAAGSFTSLGATAITRNQAAEMSDDAYLVANVKERARARIRTGFGDLAVELFVDVAPEACYNFVMLAKKGYYKNVIFHRNIKNFMIQTGDPTGTGRGGQSHFGHTFGDEFKNLSHNDRGILSMANKGPGTNSSQFFITYKQCKHLDGKHTIFGKVLEGLEVLDAMESVEVDANDRPKKPIVMQEVEVLVDPFEKALNVLRGTDAETLRKKDEAAARKAKKEANDRIFEVKGGSGEIGKYMKKAGEMSVAGEKRPLVETGGEEKVKKKGGKTSFNFSSW
ncbi:hypothetical protein BC830DRAFT_1064414 [Chytriomyces sp. MP71]|nr:hypothetical protein BC830DRAFT_1064414 [Chytriomyces sp. MP71]